MAFRQKYLKDSKLWGSDNLGGQRRLQVGDKILLFCARREPTKELDVGFWINLSKPDARRTNHAAYDNECKWLGDSESILTLVKKRISKENPAERSKKRGVIVGFTDRLERPDEDYFGWEFVRTADPEYKQVLLNDLGHGDWFQKERAIYNLISYPGKDTVDLIKPFLKDPMTTDLFLSQKRGSTTLYELRQTAYYALTLLGQSLEKPEGFVEDYAPSAFRIGFEDRVYFPFSDWRRIERREE
jgi:hypothetical protein